MRRVVRVATCAPWLSCLHRCRVVAEGVQDAAATAMRASGRMPRAQARQILNFDQYGTVNREEVLKQYKRYFDLNDPAKGGSLYLQSKIYHAKEALMDELDVPPDEREPEEAAGGGGHIEDGEEKNKEEKPRASEPER